MAVDVDGVAAIVSERGDGGCTTSLSDDKDDNPEEAILSALHNNNNNNNKILSRVGVCVCVCRSPCGDPFRG